MRSMDVSDETWEEFMEEYEKMVPAGIRKKWNGFYEIGGSRRPRSAVAAYGNVKARDWVGLGLSEPGIGPIVGGELIVYPQTMGDTVGLVLHQEGKLVTGEKTQGRGGSEGTGHFFVNSWGTNDKIGVDTARPHTVGTFPGSRRRGSRRSEGDIKVEGGVVVEHQVSGTRSP